MRQPHHHQAIEELLEHCSPAELQSHENVDPLLQSKWAGEGIEGVLVS